MIRNACRTAERVGFDPATGLHMEEVPTVPEPVVLEDSKYVVRLVRCRSHNLNQQWIVLQADMKFIESCLP